MTQRVVSLDQQSKELLMAIQGSMERVFWEISRLRYERQGARADMQLIKARLETIQHSNVKINKRRKR